jgi:hypothetical protein
MQDKSLKLHIKKWIGEENVEVEEVNCTGLKCFEESGEKAYRIWVREEGTKEEN